MNKGIIAFVIIVIVGVGAYFLTQKSDETDKASSNGTSTSSTDSGALSQEEFLKGASMGETKDETGKTEVAATIDDFVFDQTVLTVSKGTKVTWTNNGSIQHNVVSFEDSPNSGLNGELLSEGESYSYTFDEPGTYYYYCTPHPTQMRGVIIVE